eukprot:CAMPEP_0178897238 /NCGR_PEP_ID=MMETSP0786-20121207/1633_1 /TAXON_ID=186022 /ORGANISM="Thalassionema frauenfeldii, Strain CCMP 1798" /LENGTH=308 /DNA_ID=CAMNT_0020567761 /DNA_START=32 /DNA_END=955 /DNA_ORIENTATION=+
MGIQSKAAKAVDSSNPIQSAQTDSSITDRLNDMPSETGSLLLETDPLSSSRSNQRSFHHGSEVDENEETGRLSPPIQSMSASPIREGNVYDLAPQTPNSSNSNSNPRSDVRLHGTLDISENDNLSSTDGSTSASSNSSTGTSSIRRRRPLHRRNRRMSAPSVPETIEERRSLRQSLDAGMTTLRRFLSLGLGSSSSTSRPALSRASQHALSSRDDLTLLIRPTTNSIESQSQGLSFHEGASRQRALSEPEGQLRDYYFQQVMMEDQVGTDPASPQQQIQQTSHTSAISTITNQQDDDSQQLREARNRW